MVAAPIATVTARDRNFLYLENVASIFSKQDNMQQVIQYLIQVGGITRHTRYIVTSGIWGCGLMVGGVW